MICIHASYVGVFPGGDRDSNPGPCIYYALSLSTELSSRGICKCLNASYKLHLKEGTLKNQINIPYS